jgi:hypothetical protein
LVVDEHAQEHTPLTPLAAALSGRIIGSGCVAMATSGSDTSSG